MNRYLCLIVFLVLNFPVNAIEFELGDYISSSENGCKMEIRFMDSSSASITEICLSEEKKRVQASWEKNENMVILKTKTHKISLFITSLCHEPKGCSGPILLNMSKEHYSQYLSFDFRRKNA